VQVPALPGIAHEVQASQEGEPQQTDSTHVVPPAQSPLTLQRFPWAQGGQLGPPQPTSVSVPASALQTGPPSAPPVPVVDEDVDEDEDVDVDVELEPMVPPEPVADIALELAVVVAVPPLPPHVRRSPQSDES
jgi:hypothetical protein